VDTACSSSLLALDHALSAMRAGKCDAAVVGGTHVCINPGMSAQFAKLGMLSPGGASKSFDVSGRCCQIITRTVVPACFVMFDSSCYRCGLIRECQFAIKKQILNFDKAIATSRLATAGTVPTCGVRLKLH